MNRLGRAEISTGEFVDLDTSLARVEAVTSDDVRSLAAQLLSGPLSTVVVGEVDETSFPVPTTTSGSTPR
jgi:predicted Zn-dependent peptidase